MQGWVQVAALVLGTLGIVANVLLMVAWWRTREGRHRLNLQMVGAIAGLDFLTALLVVFKNIMSLVMGNQELLDTAWFCPFFGTPLLVLTCFSIVLISVMSMDRYCLVVHRFGISCLWGWIFTSVIGAIPTLILISNTAINGLKPEPTLSYCRPLGPGLLITFSRYLATCLILFGLIVIAFCYISIYNTCRKITAIHLTMPGRYLVILLLYQFCWGPKFITSLWELFDEPTTIPNSLVTLGMLSIIMLLVVNPFLVFTLQSTLRQEVNTMFCYKKSSPADVF
ncbi:hypothetical protein DSO57_1018088 [Entomophthora muscae]|uniref:Uncharacterized protein n=1 Tax=Entomophthora muscae TaxID=34485 RepID=A0ACC2RVM9_9FUNG|nr:hypothetical protein DSO57_1018088 [Entomophthora muscae]